MVVTASELALSIAGIAATLAVGLAGLYFTHKARVSPYRELLYAQQMEAYRSLIPILAEYTFSATSIIGPSVASLDDERKLRILRDTRPQDERLHAAYRAWSFVLPREVHERIVDLINMRNGLLRADILGPRQKDLLANSAGAAEALARAYQHVIAAARQQLGVERLSSTTRRLIGVNDQFEIDVTRGSLLRQEGKQ